MTHRAPRHILILGGGFGGIYAALELDKQLARREDVAVTLVNRENFFLFTPMLHEVAASDLDLTHIVNPIRKLLKHVKFFQGEVTALDLDQRAVTVRHGDDGHAHELKYDAIVLGLGSVTNYFGIKGLAERAFTMKSLGDATRLRNHLIQRLENADYECSADTRELSLSVLVAGGGFAGVETAAAINDFVHEALPHFPNLSASQVHMTLVHAGPHLLPELGEELGHYAARKLTERGVEVRLNAHLSAIDGAEVLLDDGARLEAGTLVWAAGTSPHPLIASLPCALERGRVEVDATLAVPGHCGVWALGDCASVPDLSAAGGTRCPPTAQHALRQAHTLAANLAASFDGRPLRPFRFRTLGALAAIGRRTGVAKIAGVRFSGFVAWWLWRTIYLLKLPRFEKKVRVLLDWTLDLVFSKDLVQYDSTFGHPGPGIPGLAQVPQEVYGATAPPSDRSHEPNALPEESKP